MIGQLIKPFGTRRAALKLGFEAGGTTESFN
jgi:hypothetical protein